MCVLVLYFVYCSDVMNVFTTEQLHRAASEPEV